ncbi:conserved hypothetical protein [Nocardioides sp. AX2bis]|nr:conserved hypothetical protein [Nocardioides sp. AX2bis]
MGEDGGVTSPSGPARRDAMGRSALHYAAVDADNVTVRRLLDEGADVRAVDGRGFTPLHFAAQQGNLEGVRVLLAAGADPRAQNALGNDPLRSAMQAPQDLELVINELMAHGADPESPNAHGSSTATMVRLMERQDLADLMGIRLSG